MPLSDEKTVAICFSCARQCIDASTLDHYIFLRGKAISLNSQVRLLGVMLDSKLTSSAHVAKLKKECSFVKFQV